MDVNCLYFGIGLSVIFIDGVRQQLLIRASSYKVILTLSTALFVLGVIVHFTPQRNNWAAGALLAPLLTLLYFRLCLRAFIRWQHREPIDVTFNWKRGLVKDRVFGFAFPFGAIAILAVTILATDRLARAGW